MTQKPKNNLQIKIMRRITCFIFLFCGLMVNPQPVVEPDETNDPVITDVPPPSGIPTDPRILMIATTRGSLVPAKIDKDTSVQELHAYHYRRYNADYSCYAMIENDMFIIGGSGVSQKQIAKVRNCNLETQNITVPLVGLFKYRWIINFSRVSF